MHLFQLIARTSKAKFHIVVDLTIPTVLPAKSDSDVMFCLQSYQGLKIDISLIY